MSINAKIKVDKTRIPKEVPVFNGVDSIEITIEEIFKFGIFKYEIQPDHLHESDFDYLFSKIPAYELLYTDWIDIKPTQIINKSTDDRNMKEISEVIGIALGLKVTTEALKINPNQIEKIPTPAIGKYLDYKVITNGLEYEIETKGTTQKYVSQFIKDIEQKKIGKKAIHFRYGTVAQINKPDSEIDSVLHLCDDPPSGLKSNDEPLQRVKHYFSPLSFILDNKYYNKLIKYYSHDLAKPPQYSNKLFFGKYVFKNEEYYGDYFDRRLISKLLEPIAKRSQSLETLFNSATKELGSHKIFIGVNKKILPMIFDKKLSADLEKIKFEHVINRNSKTIVFRDSDGILIVRSKAKDDKQIENIFNEKEVKKRINLMRNYFNQEPEYCGASCRSKEKQGKSCAIKDL